MRLSHILAGAVAALSLAVPAMAQETVAIVGGRILTGNSVIENGTVVMRDGKIVAEGNPAEIITAELVERVFGMPCMIIDDPLSHTPLVIPRGRYHCDAPHA